MKILFCANIYENNFVGPARFAEMLLKINEWHKGEHEVRILTADVEEEKMTIYKMNHSFPSSLRFFDVWTRGYSFYKNAKRIKKEFDFEVLIFGDSMYGLMTKYLLADKKIFIGGLINDYNFFKVRWHDIFKLKSWHYLWFHQKIEKKAAQKLDLIFTCSHYLKNRIEQEYQVNPNKVHCLYHTCDIIKIPFNPKRLEDKHPVKILFVKHRFDIGGLEDLSKALLQLNSYQFSISILGPSPKNEKKIVAFFERTPHIHVNFVGTVGHEIVQSAMQNHDILCVPSHIESLGITNIEGLAHGINVVTTNVGGIPEVMNHGKNGWLCQPANLKSLAKALEDCIKSTVEERLKKQQAGRKFVEENFGEREIIIRLLHLLNTQCTA